MLIERGNPLYPSEEIEWDLQHTQTSVFHMPSLNFSPFLPACAPYVQGQNIGMGCLNGSPPHLHAPARNSL